MSKFIKTLIISLFVIFTFCRTAIAGSLSSPFVEVKLTNLKPGATYSVEEETGKALIIKNGTESTISIGIEPEVPVDYNLVPGYEPIPDLSWVTIENSYFEEVAAGESATTDISISVPEGEEYKSKKYQVYIYSHTAGIETFRMGIMSRILIETEEPPPPLEQ